jgi:hypothetical protein
MQPGLGESTLHSMDSATSLISGQTRFILLMLRACASVAITTTSKLVEVV